MASSGLIGPFRLDPRTISVEITRTSAGTYALGEVRSDGGFYIYYVGRSDTDVGNRLLDHAGKYPAFKYGYSSSPQAAFEKECELYHNFGPPDNTLHPDRPKNSGWKYPHCRQFD